MNKKILLSLLFCIIGLAAVSCERYPLNSLKSLPATIEGWPSPWYIYDNGEVLTKGNPVPRVWDADTGCDIGCYPDMSYSDNGRICIQFRWSGNVSGIGDYAGFGLATSQVYFTETKNMSKSGYTKLKFFIKGTLADSCEAKIEIPNGKGGSFPVDSLTFTKDSLSPDWTEKTINLIHTKEGWEAQQFYISVALSPVGSNKTNGGEIYLDDIRFER